MLTHLKNPLPENFLHHSNQALVVALALISFSVRAQVSAGGPVTAGSNAPVTSTDPARRGNNRAPATPRNPVPILPALPAPNDTSFYASNDVPHGRVEIVQYKTSIGVEKRMHIYLPPGYDAGVDKRYPVLYLNHGGGENDSHWTANNQRSGGFAHLILDNLIAAGKARPMIVAMPNTGGVVSGTPPKPGTDDACSQEYLKDILPYVDGHYRTRTNRESRAVAGLSMDGFVILNTPGEERWTPPPLFETLRRRETINCHFGHGGSVDS